MKANQSCSTTYVKICLRLSQLPVSQLLAGCGLTEHDLNTQGFIDARCHAVIMRNIDRSADEPAWAAISGSQFGISSHGAIGFAALSAPTLGAALQLMTDFHAVRTNTFDASLEKNDDRYQFKMWDLTGDDQYARWVAEGTLKVLQTLIETIIGHPDGANIRFYFNFPRPSYAKQLAEVYASPCQFDAEFSGISLPASWWDIRSPLYDESSYRTNIAKCRSILASQGYGRNTADQIHNRLACHFEHVLAGSEDYSPPNLSCLASGLHITPRTLIRRLRQDGTSYKTLLESLRKEYANNLLNETHLTIADIGYKLGYKDPANFGRAFRQWFGVSPAVSRRLGVPL